MGRLFETIVVKLALIAYVVAMEWIHLKEMCYTHNNRTVRPRRDSSMTGVCGFWKKSCCSEDDALNIQSGKIVNFNHCEHEMSEKCKSHFQRKLCFQSCSPYLGPWLKTREGHERYRRFQFLPLCRSQCEIWWNDCKEEMTCREDWSNDGSQLCLHETKCMRFTEVYKDATYFCEHVFGPFEFLVVNDYDHCMSLFDDMRDNKFVARIFAERMEASGEEALYEHNYNYSLERTPPDGESPAGNPPQAKYLILCFFLGGILAILGIIAGCFILLKCKPELKRSASRISLFPNNGEEERGESEMN